MSVDERAMAEAEIELKETKQKRRLISTIRFIGELCKEGLLKTSIMYDCIENLIATQDEAGNFNGWMKVQDEQYIELLCRLLHTVGRKLEESANDEHYTKFNWYFARLHELSSDKSLNSRIRFSLEEVIQLRANGWQSRREEEGPAKLEAIYQKAQAEEQAKLQKSQQQGGGGQYGGQQQQRGGFQQQGRPGQGQQGYGQQGQQQQGSSGRPGMQDVRGGGGRTTQVINFIPI